MAAGGKSFQDHVCRASLQTNSGKPRVMPAQAMKSVREFRSNTSGDHRRALLRSTYFTGVGKPFNACGERDVRAADRLLQGESTVAARPLTLH